MKEQEKLSELVDQSVEFGELKHRFGEDNARDILRTLEKMTGICEELVSAWSYEDRMTNVMLAMAQQRSLSSQTRH